ncbi:MAG: fumarylacetoacetate hydrolase family protein [Prochlorotrichaceae cyanobacterium]|jgi:2-keto-4-pentenoate hydratase/2-oxohepta-3-ene-1,7-dioic acid hydratase in catechol pathway
MAQRYVRIQTGDGQVHYGLLQLNREVEILSAAPWLEGKSVGTVLDPDRYQLLAPCTPSKIVAVGKNYAAHAAEMGGEVPAEPLIFLKPSSAIIADQSPIFYPPQSQRVDYEGELAIVIGETCRDCSPLEAQTKIWGYTIANDVTARDLQKSDATWARGKGFDTFCPLGPWIVREVAPGALLQTFLNDDRQPVQSAPIDQMVFSPETIVSYISHIMTLLPGDVILTGTPEGIGPVQVGDTIHVEIEGIGRISNPVQARRLNRDEENEE